MSSPNQFFMFAELVIEKEKIVLNMSTQIMRVFQGLPPII